MARTRQPSHAREQTHDHDHDHAPVVADVGNAARQEAVRQALGSGGQGAAARLTPQQQFQQRYLREKNRPLDQNRQNIPRWRELSPEEAAVRQAVQGAMGALPLIGDNFQPPQAGERGYTTTVNGKTFLYDQVQEDPNNPTQTSDLMGPQASQFYSRAFTTPRPKKNPNDRNERQFTDVTVLNPNGTTSVLRQNEHGMVELPESGFGFGTYNRNDVRYPNGNRQPDQWGKPAVVANLMNIGADYRTMFPNQSVQYGDIATNDNKSPLLDTGRTSRHATHGEGDQVDLLYPGNMFQTNSLIRTAENWGANNFYYDPGMQGDAFFSPNTRATPESHHDDHLHMGWGRGGPT